MFWPIIPTRTLIQAQTFTISSNTADLDIYSQVGSPSVASSVTGTLNPGVYIYSTSTSNAAVELPAGFDPGSDITFNVDGIVVGKGGAGGPGGDSPSGPNPTSGGNGGAGGDAFNIAFPGGITINRSPTGQIRGGGGGGGGADFDPPGCEGGSGGGGASSDQSPALAGPTDRPSSQGGVGNFGGGGPGGSGDSDSPSPGGGPPEAPSPEPGCSAGDGGAGGAHGSAGSPSNPGPSGGTGGAAGKAVDLNGNPITWSAGGPPSPSIMGAVS